ncbi:MAG: hypothetical protein RL042_12 [Nitrospirota bacterium]
MLAESGARESPVQYVVRSLDFFRQRHLAPDSTKGFGAREVVPRFQTCNLCFAVGGDDDGGVDAFVDAGLEEERHIVYHHGVRILSCGLFRQPGLLARNTGVNDPFQCTAFRWMVKDDRAEGVAVNGAVRIEDGLAECSDDLAPGRFARFDDLPRQLVGIDHNRAALLEHRGDGALAGGDAACEADHNHGCGA